MAGSVDKCGAPEWKSRDGGSPDSFRQRHMAMLNVWVKIYEDSSGDNE
jgi:hypothetical protein